VLRDWASVARKLKKLPSILEYERAGRFSGKPFQRLYGSWAGTTEGFCKFVDKHRWQKQWEDVLAMIAHGQARNTAARMSDAAGTNATAGPAAGKRAWLEKEVPQRRDFAGPSGIWPPVTVAGAGA
jgi:hypothetical protein